MSEGTFPANHNNCRLLCHLLVILKVIIANRVDPLDQGSHCLPVCKNRFEKFAGIFSRRHKQTTFSGAGILCILRVSWQIHFVAFFFFHSPRETPFLSSYWLSCEPTPSENGYTIKRNNLLLILSFKGRLLSRREVNKYDRVAFPKSESISFKFCFISENLDLPP